MGNDILYEYESILMGKQKIFLLSFSDQTPDKKKAFREVWRYAITDILRWTPEDALKNMDMNVVTKLKLDRTLKCIGLNPKSRIDFREVLAIVFPGRIKDSLKDRVIEEYERVLGLGRWQYDTDTQIGKFHKGFFADSDAAEKAAICLNYAVSMYLGDMNLVDRYKFFADKKKGMDFITDVKLYPVLRDMYDSPLDYFHYSLDHYERDYIMYYEMKLREKVHSVQNEKDKAERKAEREARKARKKEKESEEEQSDTVAE